MLEAYFSLLIETINLLINTKSNFCKKKGCKELYQLYLLLDKILESSKRVRAKLEDVRKGETAIEVNDELKNLTELTKDVSLKLFDIRKLEIFDGDLLDDLSYLIGMKYELLFLLCSRLFTRMKDKEKYLRKITINMALFHESISLRSSVIGYLLRLEMDDPTSKKFPEEMPEGMPPVLFIESIPISEKDRLTELLWGVDQNIEQLQVCKEALREFIKKNCSFEQL